MIIPQQKIIVNDGSKRNRLRVQSAMAGKFDKYPTPEKVSMLYFSGVKIVFCLMFRHIGDFVDERES